MCVSNTVGYLNIVKEVFVQRDEKGKTLEFNENVILCDMLLISLTTGNLFVLCFHCYYPNIMVYLFAFGFEPKIVFQVFYL